MAENVVFSEFEVTAVGFLLMDTEGKAAEGESVVTSECVGELSEEIEVRTTIKRCRRRIIKKRRTKETGNGTVSLSLHMPYEMYQKALGREDKRFNKGVYVSGADTVHPYIQLVARVEDEDGKIKYKAYPKCQVTENVTRTITNGEDEVAESELSLSFMPDANGIGMYEALEDDITKEIADKWMAEWTPALMLAAAAASEEGN